MKTEKCILKLKNVRMQVKRHVPQPGDSFVVLATDGLWCVHAAASAQLPGALFLPLQLSARSKLKPLTCAPVVGARLPASYRLGTSVVGSVCSVELLCGLRDFVALWWYRLYCIHL